MESSEESNNVDLIRLPLMKVAHITPHIGGGVGSVLLSLFESMGSRGIDNRLYCLDNTKSRFESLSAISYKIDGLFFKHDIQTNLEKSFDQIDLILLHYWNHPLLAKFLSQSLLPKNKLVIWCHNSGLFEPHLLPNYLFDISSKVVFTSGCSYAAHNMQDRISAFPERYGVVHSTRSLEAFLEIGHSRNYAKSVKNLLYIGTVSESKMHPKSAKIFAQLSKQGFSIQVVGGPDHIEFTAAVRSYGGEVEVHGELENVVPFFQNADLFIYPLRPDHYGTGEQVILEAMASGLPVVAFDNPAERAILEKGGGVLVSDAQDFIKSAIRLASGPSDYLGNMSVVGINRVKSEFSVKQMTNNLIDIMSNVAEGTRLDVVDHGSCLYPRIGMDELALYALHSFFDGEEMVSNNADSLSSLEDLVFEKIRPYLKASDSASKWCGLTKSTPFHYQRYFPDNVNLKSLCRKIVAKCGVS